MTPEEEAMLLNELLSPRTAAPDPTAFAPGPFVDEVAPQIHGPGDRGSFFERYNTAQGPRGWQVHGDPFERGQGFVAPLALLAGFLNARGRQAGQERTEANAVDARARTQAAERNKSNLEISRENRQRESRRMERLETARLARDTAKQGRADTKAEDDAARTYTIQPSMLKRLGMPELAGEKLTRKEYLDFTGKSEPKDNATAARQEAAAGRQEAAAVRAANAAERQARLAQVQTTGQLHDDYGKDKDIQSYRGALQNLDQMRSLAKQGTGPGDLAFLTSFARAIEPPGVISVVREEDLRNASQSVGKMRRFLNLPGEYFSGQRLTESGRREILASAETITSSRRAAHDVAESQYTSRAESGGVDPSQFIRKYAPPGTSGAPDLRQFVRP